MFNIYGEQKKKCKEFTCNSNKIKSKWPITTVKKTWVLAINSKTVVIEKQMFVNRIAEEKKVEKYIIAYCTRQYLFIVSNGRPWALAEKGSEWPSKRVKRNFLRRTSNISWATSRIHSGKQKLLN